LEGELISSVVSWLQGNDLNELHDDFEFIDPGKRALEKFWDQAIEIYPELESCASIKLKPAFSESFCLWFTTSQRYCKIYFSGQSQFPICKFYWEDYHIFEFYSEDNREAARILKRWFCDNVMPSVMAQEFSWLDTKRLSKLYDLGKVIEAEFIRSWDEIEQFYKEGYKKFNLNLDRINILNFISQLRQKGFDRTLRAGTSHFTLVLSRSRYHGLKVGQPFLIFDFAGLKIYNCTDFRGRVNLTFHRFEITPQIERLLKKLETKDIN